MKMFQAYEAVDTFNNVIFAFRSFDPMYRAPQSLGPALLIQWDSGLVVPRVDWSIRYAPYTLERNSMVGGIYAVLGSWARTKCSKLSAWTSALEQLYGTGRKARLASHINRSAKQPRPVMRAVRECSSLQKFDSHIVTFVPSVRGRVSREDEKFWACC